MLNNNKQNVFSSKDPKSTFIIGFIVGILLLGTIGFFVLLAKMIANKYEGGSSLSADTKTLPSAQAPAPAAGGRVNIQLTASEHLRGNPNALVKIVEFSDVECPFCRQFHPTMQQVISEYGDQVAWIYKHFPIDTLHSQARAGAEASECIAEQAGNQGFWQFIDGLFANQSRLGTGLYEELAGQIGVNVGKFRDCVSSRKYQDKVEADFQQGQSYGVTGTPGNFINGLSVKGALPFNTLKQIIDSELTK